MPRLKIEPAVGLEHAYDITPGAVIGVVELKDLSVRIQPKLPLDRLIFMMSYAFDPACWRDTLSDFKESDTLVEALVPSFVSQVRRAVRRGVIQGYEEREEALAGVKGRVRFDEQLRNRFGIAPPIEVSYDEFTDDITPNRLIKAAAIRLSRLKLKDRQNRNDLRNLLRGFAAVSAVEFSHKDVPEVIYSRLNEHYRPAVELARLILRSSSFELGRGGPVGRSFLIDMNVLFENFVITALRENLGLRASEFPQGARGRQLFLDSDHFVTLKPDLSWWVGGRPVFVGDLKYKKLDVDQFKHADLYQLLAYTVATGLEEGLLVYAARESAPGTVVVQKAGKRLTIVTLGLTGSPAEILDEVARIGDMITDMRSDRGDPYDTHSPAHRVAALES